MVAESQYFPEAVDFHLQPDVLLHFLLLLIKKQAAPEFCCRLSLVAFGVGFGDGFGVGRRVG